MLKNMKIQILLLLFFLFSFTVSAQKKFVFEGTADQYTYESVVLRYTSASGEEITLKENVINGKFTFRGNINEPTFATIGKDLESLIIGGDLSKQIVLEPSKMAFIINGNDFKSAKVVGSKTNTELDTFTEKKDAIQKEMNPVLVEFDKKSEIYYEVAQQAKQIEGVRDSLSKKVDSLELALWPYYKRLEDLNLNFLESNPNSFLSAYNLYSNFGQLPFEKGIELYGSLMPKVKKSFYGKKVNDEIERIKKSRPGSKAFNFISTDVNGERLTLDMFKGKYVLLDFWASWCVPCRQGNPHLLQLYSLYKSKGFEIIGISDDDNNPKAWRNAIDKDGIGVWKHILRGLKRTEKGFDNSTDLLVPYTVSSLPTKILIDPAGVIIGRYGSGGENDKAMDIKLEELFGK